MIEASFSKEDGLMLEELNVAVERNVSENVTRADESILVDHQQHFRGESTKASEEGSLSTKSKGTVDEGTSTQPLLRGDSGTNKCLKANRSPYKITCLKRTLEPYRQECSSVKKSLEEVTCQKSSLLPSHTFRHDSFNAKERTVEESPSKRRKIDDYFGQKNDQTRDKQSVKKTFEKGETGRESSNGRKVERKRLSVDGRGESNSNCNEHSQAISETEQSKVKKKKKKELKTESNQKSRNSIHTGHESILRREDDSQMAATSSLQDICAVYVVNENGGETSSGKKMKKKNSGSENSGEHKRKGSNTDEATPENEHSKVRKRKKKKNEFKSESSHKSTNRTYSSQVQEIMTKDKEDEQRPSTSSVHEETDEDVETTSNASSQTSTYSIQWEETEWPTVPDAYSADDVASNSDFATSPLRRTSNSRNQEAEKMSLYMAGTNEVTAGIVDLWNERKQTKKRKDGEDLSMEYVQTRLAQFVDEKLETKDQHGYNALLKACSLPSMSPHVMQNLIVVRRVDLNCRLPDDFDKHHPSAKGLIPGMSAMSVAIRRHNISCISTFKRREKDINVRDADQERNTALHHCVALASKGAFQKLFPLYKKLNWKRMFNKELESPLDIAQNLAMDSGAKKKQALDFILEEMERISPSDVFR